jgi:hypothetical protein
MAISYTVPLVAQEYSMGCWIASYRMIKSYDAGYSITDEPYYEEDWLGPTRGLNTDQQNIQNFCLANGLKYRYIGNIRAKLEIVKTWLNNKPVMVCGKVPNAHFYVLTGIDADSGDFDTTTVDINDPLPVNGGKILPGTSLAKMANMFPNGFYWIIQTQ